MGGACSSQSNGGLWCCVRFVFSLCRAQIHFCTISTQQSAAQRSYIYLNAFKYEIHDIAREVDTGSSDEETDEENSPTNYGNNTSSKNDMRAPLLGDQDGALTKSARKSRPASDRIQTDNKLENGTSPFVDNQQVSLETSSSEPESKIPRWKARIMIQALVRGYLMRRRFKRLKRRMLVCREILATEESYVKSLNLMLALGLFPLREAGKTPERAIITEQEIRILFSSIEVLVPLHQVFLDKLKPKVDKFNVDTLIGDCMDELTKYVRIYTDYINNFDESRELLTRLTTGPQQNKKFVQFIENFHDHPDTIPVGDLASFLIMPIQRVPRYRMLLDSLIACTPATHPDLPSLKASVDKIKEIADYMNDRKRMKDQSNEVLRVFNWLTPPVEDLIQPGRHLLKEGYLTQFKLDKSLEDQEESFFFLFDDILIKTEEKKKGERYKVEAVLQLRDYVVVENPDPNTRSSSLNAQPTVLPPGTFMLRSDGPSLFLVAKTESESTKWRQTINNAVGSVVRKLSTLKITPEARAVAVKDQIAKQYSDPSKIQVHSPQSGLRKFAMKKQHGQSVSSTDTPKS